jgi:hypothetical protein
MQVRSSGSPNTLLPLDKDGKAKTSGLRKEGKELPLTSEPTVSSYKFSLSSPDSTANLQHQHNIQIQSNTDGNLSRNYIGEEAIDNGDAIQSANFKADEH